MGHWAVLSVLTEQNEEAIRYIYKLKLKFKFIGLITVLVMRVFVVEHLKYPLP